MAMNQLLLSRFIIYSMSQAKHHCTYLLDSRIAMFRATILLQPYVQVEQAFFTVTVLRCGEVLSDIQCLRTSIMICYLFIM